MGLRGQWHRKACVYEAEALACWLSGSPLRPLFGDRVLACVGEIVLVRGLGCLWALGRAGGARAL
jgi:hypothetical protein